MLCLERKGVIMASYAGGLCGIYGGYLMTRWIYRKSWPWTASTFTSVTITLAANLALVSAFGGSIDTS